jgi:hypothetical protein
LRRGNYGASNNVIGGTDPGAGNTIASNCSAGVLISGGSGNTIRGNAITVGKGLSRILLVGDGNHQQSSPVLFGAMVDVTSSVNGTLSNTPNSTFTIDFYGGAYLGSTTVTTDGSGNAKLLVDGLEAGGHRYRH